jgi:hypothetical protein
MIHYSGLGCISIHNQLFVVVIRARAMPKREIHMSSIGFQGISLRGIHRIHNHWQIASHALSSIGVLDKLGVCRSEEQWDHHKHWHCSHDVDWRKTQGETGLQRSYSCPFYKMKDRVSCMYHAGSTRVSHEYHAYINQIVHSLWKVFDSFLDVAVGQLVVGVGSLLLFLFLRVLSLLFSAGRLWELCGGMK